MSQVIEADGIKTIPYVARELSIREVRDFDVYTFISPKRGMRCVRVIGIPALALALRLEFDPNVQSFVERPRLLSCASGVFEFSFWYRTSEGREALPMVVHATDSVPEVAGRWRHRKAEQLVVAAQDAQLPLEFVFESDLIAQSAEISKWLRMLPSVQLAHRFPHRFELQTRIMEIANQFERLRVSQIVDTLSSYSAADLHCVICDLVHAGKLALDPNTKLNQQTICYRKTNS